MENSSKLHEAIEELHSDVLAVLTEAKLDGKAKLRLAEVAKGLLELLRDLKAQGHPPRNWFTQINLRFVVLVRDLFGIGPADGNRISESGPYAGRDSQTPGFDTANDR